MYIDCYLYIPCLLALATVALAFTLVSRRLPRQSSLAVKLFVYISYIASLEELCRLIAM